MAASWSDPVTPCTPGHGLTPHAVCNPAGNGYIYGWLDADTAKFYKVGEAATMEEIPWGFPDPKGSPCGGCIEASNLNDVAIAALHAGRSADDIEKIINAVRGK